MTTLTAVDVIVDTDEAGIRREPVGWPPLAVGDAVRLSVALPDPRCVMTTLAQEELPADTGILKALVAHNRLPLADGSLAPCAGAYAAVAAPGAIRAGDRVQLVTAEN